MIWRDRDNRRAILCQIFLFGTALLLLRFTLISPFTIVGGLAILTLLIFIWLSRKKSKRLSKLASSVRDVLAGHTHFDFGEYREGELYILAADLQKISGAYREQALALKRDKVNLKDAISDISHQLKTPITSLFVIADVLQNPLTESDKDIFERQLYEQIERLDWLVKSLLTLAKLDADAVIFKRQETTLGKIARDAFDPFRIKAELAELEVKIKGQLDTTLTLDENWLREALGNIIKNAIEHTAPKGKIEIICEDLPMSKMISVRNSGALEREALAHVFERFYKRPGANKDSIGIGLSISKAIVQAQGGSVDAFSDEKTTTFSIRFAK